MDDLFGELTMPSNQEVDAIVADGINEATKLIQGKIVSIQRDNSSIADQILKLNEQLHIHLKEGGFIPVMDPNQHVQSVLLLLKQVDRLVLQLDRGSGHVSMGIVAG